MLRKPRISIVGIPNWARPRRAPFRYPKYAQDYGIEQDFEAFLLYSYDHLSESHEESDFVYLPIFWTRLHLNNNYAQVGRERLQELVDPWVEAFGDRLLTVCQYDDGPLVDLGNATIYLGSRRTPVGHDAPLLATPLPRFKKGYVRGQKYAFAGRLNTHPIRQQLFEAFRDDQRFSFQVRTPKRPKRYARFLSEAQVALCPRGYGGSSFRFFEALQVGAVPWLIGEFDTRPFKSQIDWNNYSFYSASVGDFIQQLEQQTQEEIDSRLEALRMNGLGSLRLGGWGDLLIQELTAGIDASRTY